METENVANLYRRDTEQRLLRGVYFIYCHLAGRVKIGHTKNLEQRFAFLSVACPGPIRLLGFISAIDSKSVESRIHQQFKHLHSGHGEWFYVRKDILEFVANNAEQVDTSNFSYRRSLEIAREADDDN